MIIITLVNLNDELYVEIKQLLKNNFFKIDYPNIRSFVNQSLKEKIDKIKLEYNEKLISGQKYNDKGGFNDNNENI